MECPQCEGRILNRLQYDKKAVCGCCNNTGEITQEQMIEWLVSEVRNLKDRVDDSY